MIKRHWALHHMILSPLQQFPTIMGQMWRSQSFFPQVEFFFERIQSDTPSQSPLHHTLSVNASVNTDQFSSKSTTHFKSIFIQKTGVWETTLYTSCKQIFFFFLLIQLCVYRAGEICSVKQGMIGQEVKDFLISLAGPVFQGKLSWMIVIAVRFL